MGVGQVLDAGASFDQRLAVTGEFALKSQRQQSRQYPSRIHRYTSTIARTKL
jgi:hypothetical protein